MLWNSISRQVLAGHDAWDALAKLVQDLPPGPPSGFAESFHSLASLFLPAKFCFRAVGKEGDPPLAELFQCSAGASK